MPTPEVQAQIDALKAEILKIDDALASGITSYSVDGVNVTVDLKFLAAHRQSLADRLDKLEHPPAEAKPRRLLTTFDTSKFAN